MVVIGELKYKRLGVDPEKAGVEYFKPLIRDVLLRSFTPLVKDPSREEYLVLHVDGAGSKPIISYLYHKETGETSWFKGLAQDVVAMNIDDIVTVGAEPVAFADYIGINPVRLPKIEVLKELSTGFSEVFESLQSIGSRLKFNITPVFSGGETADLPDQIRTLDVVGVVYGRVSTLKPLKASATPGSILVGLRSGGRAKYEKRENSGIMCNGLTLARHVLLNKYYRDKYPEAYESSLEKPYSGRYKLDMYVEELDMSVGEALLSPTRIYAPIIGDIIESLRESIRGLAHVTGGGLTKLLSVGEGVSYVLDSLPTPDPIFYIIQREGKIEWREMFQVFNMGIGFIVVVDDVRVAEDVVSISEKYGVNAQVVGRVEKGEAGVNSLTVKFEGVKEVFSKSLD